MRRNWNRQSRQRGGNQDRRGGHDRYGGQGGGHGGGHRGGNGARANGSRTYDSVGPEVKLRGKPEQLYRKYQTLAQDIRLSGDRVRAESLLQHAEHYYRLMGDAAPQAVQDMNGMSDMDGNGDMRPMGDEPMDDAPTGEPRGAPPQQPSMSEGEEGAQATDAPRAAPRSTAPRSAERSAPKDEDDDAPRHSSSNRPADRAADRAADDESDEAPRSRRRGPLDVSRK